MGRSLALALVIVALGGPALAADVPSSLRVQGLLLTSSGSPAQGPVDLRVALFDVVSGGNELYAKTFLATPLDRGVYEVTLDGIPQTLFEQYVSVWLEAKIASEAPLPRQRLLSQAYAMQARHADEAEVALDLLCTECVGAGALAGGSVTSAALANGSVGPQHVTFSYAAGATKGGAATGLACAGCVDATDLAPSSVVSAHIQDGAIAGADVGFNYAGSASKGGAATGLSCTGCITGSHIADHVALGGNPTVEGGLSLCTAGQSGCALDIAGMKLVDKKDGWLTARATGLRVRNAGDTGWAGLAFGDGTVYGNLTIDPGTLTVAGTGSFGGNVVIGSSGQAASLAVFGGVQIGADTATCITAKAGTLRWNAGDKVVEVCDGSAWTQSLGGGTQAPELGQSQGTAGLNCTQILQAGKSTGDGVYWIDPDGDGNTANAYQAFCDMTTDGGGWTLVAYAGSNGGGFPRMDIDVGAYSASFRTGKASRSAVLVAKQSVDMALGYHPTQNFSGSLSQMTDAVALRIPDPAIVDLKTTASNGTCTAVRAWRLKPDNSTHECIGTSSNGTAGVSASDCNEAGGQAHAGVWSKSLGGTYSSFAYGVFGTEWECNSWPNISHHWWVDTQYYNWGPSATQYWDGAVNGTASIWFRGDVNLPKPKNTQASAEASCKTILQNGHSAGDGVYWVDPDGGSTGNAHQTYCDMTTAGGGWTLVAYAGHNTYGFPRMDLDVGTFHPTIRGGKAAKSAVTLTRMSTEMALAYSPQTAHGGSMAETTDTVSFTIPSPGSVDLVPSSNSGTCVAVAARRLKPNGSTHACIGSSSNPAGISTSNCNPVNGAATAGVWSKSLGGTYGTFAYGLFGTEWNCNNWPNISHHWWIDTPSYNWEPSATQYWSGSVNGSTSVWVR